MVISIATGLVFCLGTLYAQNAVRRYVEEQVEKKAGGNNPLVGTGLLSTPPLVDKTASHASKPQKHAVQQSARTPPGCGERWTPLPTE